MTQSVRRITASHVGVTGTAQSNDKRMCLRCGIEKQVSTRRVSPGAPFMCGDCKYIDRAWARRLGIL